MYSAGKRKGKNKKKPSPKPQKSGEILRYFREIQEAFPTAKMADPALLSFHEGQLLTDPSASPTTLSVSERGLDTPAVFCS